ncbi:MAG: hypothetical protein NTY07_21235, partial [Bacteroidia bacterium]|nr:hypothetical protein [Bacteroidia bacterium]
KITNFQIPTHFRVEAQFTYQVKPFPYPPYYSIRNYTINNKSITFSFESLWLENSIHPLFAHLETSGLATADVRFDLFRRDEQFGIRVTKGQSKTWFFDQPELQKGRAFIELLNTIYDKVEDDWMTILHGSAITDGSSTILFTAACGGGKSTIAALLQAHGLHVVSDDMVPVAAKTGRIYPFPSALSVKDGAIPVLLPWYPELEKTQIFNYPASDKQVRYLPYNQFPPQKKLINKAKALVFINFDPSVDIRLEKMSKLDAIKLFNNEAWVSSTPENARHYINWFIKLPCYRMTYSDNMKAVQTIMQIFQGE